MRFPVKACARAEGRQNLLDNMIREAASERIGSEGAIPHSFNSLFDRHGDMHVVCYLFMHIMHCFHCFPRICGLKGYVVPLVSSAKRCDRTAYIWRCKFGFCSTTQ